MTGFDWPALLRAGVQRLGLRPHEFWQLTPAELVMMLGETGASAPLTRSRLDELSDAFPDDEKE